LAAAISFQKSLSEIGAALATGKHVIVVGEREQVFHSLPCVTVYPSFAALDLHLNRQREQRPVKLAA
jgi:hypothetical protein